MRLIKSFFFYELVLPVNPYGAVLASVLGFLDVDHLPIQIGVVQFHRLADAAFRNIHKRHA